MNYLSVCSGIEAASQAWTPLGWTPVAFSEIEPFPCAVLANHYPDTPNWGDMNNFKEWPDADVDVLCGGTPCQSFSNAGDRAGLDDPRGQLMLTYGAISARYRPRWLVWENVPGVLSSNEGRDFASLLGLLSGQRIEPPEGGWQSAGFVAGYPNAYGLAWRVLDAQFVRVESHPRAVPQRRNRVFVVGYLGDWRRAAAVLLERESLRGDPAPRREAGARVAGAIGCGSPASGGRIGPDEAAANQLVAGAAYGISSDCFDRDGEGANGTAGEHSGIGIATELAYALRAKRPGGVAQMAYGGNNTTGPIDVATARNACASASGRMDFESETFIAHTLRGEGFDASEDGTGRGTPLVPVTFNGEDDGSTYEADASSVLHTLRQQVGAEAVAEWGSRMLDSLQRQDVLRAWLHGESLRSKAEDFRSFVDDRPLARQEGAAARAMREVWEQGPDGGGSPQGRGLAKQLAFELGEALSELPSLGTFSEATVRHLRGRAQGVRLLRKALSTFQEARRPDETRVGNKGDLRDQRLLDDEPLTRVVREACTAKAARNSHFAVRRLLPVECEKLQGMQPGWTAITHRGKPAADGPRYKAIGNSWAVNCARWIGERIAMVDRIT